MLGVGAAPGWVWRLVSRRVVAGRTSQAQSLRSSRERASRGRPGVRSTSAPAAAGGGWSAGNGGADAVVVVAGNATVRPSDADESRLPSLRDAAEPLNGVGRHASSR